VWRIALAGLLAVAAAPAVQDAPGVVVERVDRGGTAARAGLRTGDLLRNWSAPSGARGRLRSPFDLAEVQALHGPIGPVTVAGSRAGQALAAQLDPGEWRLEVRPVLERGQLHAYEEARTGLKGPQPDEAVGRLRALAAGTTRRDLAAWILEQAGTAMAGRARWEEAGRLFGEARVLADGVAERALIWEAEASALQPRNMAGSQAALREAIELRRGVPGLEMAMAADLAAMARIHRRTSDWVAGEAAGREALALAEAASPGSLVVADAATEIIDMVALRSVEEGAALTDRAFAIRQRLAPESMAMARSWTQLAGFAYRRGDLVTAEDHWQRTLDLQRRLDPGGWEQASSLNNLTLVSFHQGDYARAERLQREALHLEEQANPESREVAVVLGNLCVVLLARGDVSAAEPLCRRSLAIAERLKAESVDVAYALGTMAEVARLSGDAGAAKELVTRALALWERLGPESEERAVHLTAQARQNLEAGELDTAQERGSQAQALLERIGPQTLSFAEALHLMGEIARRRGDPAAEELYRRALAIRSQAAPGSRMEAVSLHALGLAGRDAGRLDEAIELTGRAIDIFDGQRGRIGGSYEARTRFSAKTAAAYRDHLDLLLERDEAARAFHVLERSRSRAFLDLLAERELTLPEATAEQERERRKLDVEYDRVLASLSEPGTTPEAAATAVARLRELRGRRDALVERLRYESPRLAAIRYPVPSDLAAARVSLDEGSVLLAYAVERTRTVLFVVEPAGRPGPGLTVLTLPAGEERLREAVTAFRREVERGPRGDRATLRRLGAELYASLLEPVEAQLEAARRIVLSPDGPLHPLPWAALVRRDAYLVEWRALHTTPSATVYGELFRRRDVAGRRWAQDLVAFGDPGGAVSGAPASRALPASRREVQALGGLFPGRSQVFIGKAATEVRARSLGRDVRYVHFASHGLLDRRFPLDSALALARPDAGAEDGENGLLQAWEILERVRLDAEMVTLAACQSGLGEEVRGEGILGLTGAFLHAGARSVVASLWSVSDRTTAELMQGFYRRLARHEPRDEALRNAQVEMIRADGLRSHPFYWAAFHLVGDRR
jgi:CHAT domain-containing protein